MDTTPNTITLTFDEAANCYSALLSYTNDMKRYASELTEQGRTDEARKVRQHNVEPQMATWRKLKNFLHEQAPYLF